MFGYRSPTIIVSSTASSNSPRFIRPLTLGRLITTFTLFATIVLTMSAHYTSPPTETSALLLKWGLPFQGALMVLLVVAMVADGLETLRRRRERKEAEKSDEEMKPMRRERARGVNSDMGSRGQTPWSPEFGGVTPPALRAPPGMGERLWEGRRVGAQYA